MVKRSLNIPESQSFFLFGARGTGKSTLLKERFGAGDKILWVDLLDPIIEETYTLAPQEFKKAIIARPNLEWVIVDEVQKCPKLLNYAHQLIEEKKIKFALTGSSARRLKQKGVNLLAGRAILRNLYPFTHRELKNDFQLEDVLHFGSMPTIYSLKTDAEKKDYLRAYALTYVKNEVQSEQWVRKLEPFRRFLPVAAQMNGEIINFSNIAADVGVDITTVQSYYEILEDTLLGFELPAFSRSVRKQQRKASKFYFLDPGISRAFNRTLDFPIAPGSTEYGRAFEHWVILEMRRLASYSRMDYSIFYLRTKDDVEIDIILELPKGHFKLIEIKSKSRVDERDARTLSHFLKDFPKAEFYLLSQDPIPKIYCDKIRALPWDQGLEALGL